MNIRNKTLSILFSILTIGYSGKDSDNNKTIRHKGIVLNIDQPRETFLSYTGQYRTLTKDGSIAIMQIPDPGTKTTNILNSFPRNSFKDKIQHCADNYQLQHVGAYYIPLDEHTTDLNVLSPSQIESLYKNHPSDFINAIEDYITVSKKMHIKGMVNNKSGKSGKSGVPLFDSNKLAVLCGNGDRKREIKFVFENVEGIDMGNPTPCGELVKMFPDKQHKEIIINAIK